MIRSAAATAVIAVAIFLSWRDLTSDNGGQSVAHAAVDKGSDDDREESFADFKNTVPQPRMKSRMGGPVLKFLFCFSWGYRRVFEEFSRVVQERYPTLTIEGDNFPPPPHKAMLAQVLSVVKLGLIVAILFGFDPFAAIGMQAPGFFQWALQNKIYACMMTFFLSNAIEGQLISTGAFEIMLNDVPVWSKLEVGRIPSPPELLQILDSQMKMSGIAGGGPIL